jgi:hypothetical protein
LLRLKERKRRNVRLDFAKTIGNTILKFSKWIGSMAQEVRALV